jgi:hypothetical protein
VAAPRGTAQDLSPRSSTDRGSRTCVRVGLFGHA